jgi:hypothetical protein
MPSLAVRNRLSAPRPANAPADGSARTMATERAGYLGGRAAHACIVDRCPFVVNQTFRSCREKNARHLSGVGSRSPSFSMTANRAIARELAERSVVLLDNRGQALPLRDMRSVAVVGPCADDPLTFLGCYSFPNHVLHAHPELGLGIEVPSLLAALEAELPQLTMTHERGCEIAGDDRSGFSAAAEAARAADLCIAVVGDRAGLFGRGTSGEGCDAEDLALPGVQGDLEEELLATGTPVILVVVSGRPYALGRYADRLAAAIQSFFPGEEGGPALAGVLSGRVVPSGKLPVQIPRRPGGQPGTYLHPPLGGASDVSNQDPSPLFPFGHGLSYTTFDYSNLVLSADEIGTDGEVDISCRVGNAGDLAGTEVVQLYLDDPVAQVTRPVAQLAGFTRVALQPGEQALVRFRLHADRTSFTGVDLRRIVEPGDRGDGGCLQPGPAAARDLPAHR